MKIVPLKLADAEAFLKSFERHYKAPVNPVCAIGLQEEDGKLHGAAILGMNDAGDGELAHIYCDGVSSGYTMLYGATWRAFKAMGYTKAVL